MFFMQDPHNVNSVFVAIFVKNNVTIHMFYGVGGKDVALQLYPILKDLRAKHPKEFHASLPRVRTLKDIKGLLKHN